MPLWSLINNRQKLLLEKRASEGLVLCNCHGLHNLPTKGQNSLDISKHGEYLLASNKTYFCLIDIHSNLYNSKLPQNFKRSTYICSCESNNKWSELLSYDCVLSKPLRYKSACTASLWYPVDNSIFLTSGDRVVDVWDILVPEIAYTFTNLPSAVKCIAVSGCSKGDPLIAAGLSCGTISICDMRSGSVNNFCKSLMIGDVTAIKFIPRSSNHIIAAYNDTSVLIWDLRLYNKPVCTLQYNDIATNDHLIIGCSIRNELIGTYSKNRNLREVQCYDFASENDIWKYIKDFNDEKFPRDQGKNYSQTKRCNTTIRRPSNKYQRLFGKQRKFSFDMLDPWCNMVFSKKNTSLYIQNDASTCSPTNLNERIKVTNNSNFEKGVVTDIQFAEDGFSMYISRLKGYIDCYDYKTFKFCKSIDTNKIIGKFQSKVTEKRYVQHMRMQLIRGEIHLAFNVSDCVGIVNVKSDVLLKLIKLDWINSQSLTGNERNLRNLRMSCNETFSEHHDPTQSIPLISEKYVTDISTLPFIRDIFAINCKGELYVIHPDKSLAVPDSIKLCYRSVKTDKL